MQKMNKLNEKKNDPEYISYLQNGDSAAVFIVRDIVKSVNTSGMWIDILSTSGGKNEYGKWDLSSITIELFPRKKKLSIQNIPVLQIKNILHGKQQMRI